MSHVVYIVTGATGSGKTTAADYFLRLTNADYVAFDIEWLSDSASNLAQRNIFFDESAWKHYGELWFEVLHSICKNGKIPVLFAPINPSDIEKNGRPTWCTGVEWFLLDCDDETRRQRIVNGRNWSSDQIEETLAEARWLRQQHIRRNVDTGKLSPTQVASEILAWLEQIRQ